MLNRINNARYSTFFFHDKACRQERVNDCSTKMLTLETVHKSHLEQLNVFDADVTAKFCKLALETLQVHGDLARNDELYGKAASRLNVSSTYS